MSKQSRKGARLLVLAWAGLNALTSYAATQDGAQQASPAQSMAKFCKKLPRPQYANLSKLQSPKDWFELYSVAPGVTAIYEPKQWQEAISYLIEGSDEALLFDTGNGIGNIAQIVSHLTDKPVTVLNSHGHYDHVGGNHQFTQVLGMSTDFTRARQTGQTNSQIAIEVSPQALCRALPAGVTQKNHTGKPYKITQFISDGHKIELGDRQLEVAHIPGHTPDAIALLDKANGLLWTGDSYYSGPIWLYAPETNLQDYRASIVKLIELSEGVHFLLPAHNTPLADPAILKQVLVEFDAMLAGELNQVKSSEGMVEYRSKRALPFSFLLRDEPLPYQ